MLNIKMLNVLKPVVNWVIPFFKENKALALIKADMQSVGEEFLARVYDSTKRLFVNDEIRKPIFEQWLKTVEEGKIPDDFSEGGVKNTIEKAVQSETDFRNEILQILKDVEQKHSELIKKHNSLIISGNDVIANQDINDSTIIINKKTK